MQTAQIQDLEPGAGISYGNKDWTIVEQKAVGATVFSSEIMDFMPFSEDEEGKNWTECSLHGYVTEDILKALVEAGANEADMVETEVDLTAVNGDTDFGKDKSKVFLLTGDQYADLKSLIPKVEEKYWLVTAYSCEEFYIGGEYLHQVRVVCPDGSLEGSKPDGGLYGVRPAIALKPSTQVTLKTSAIHDKLVELEDMLGTSSPITFTAESLALVMETAELCNQIPSVPSTMSQAEDYALNMTAEQVYLDILSKIVNGSSIVHMNDFNVYALVPVLKEKIEQEGI